MSFESQAIFEQKKIDIKNVSHILYAKKYLYNTYATSSCLSMGISKTVIDTELVK